MTAAQRLIAEVAPKLRAEGKAEGAATTLERLLTLEFGVLDAAVQARIERATMADLERWTERILSASSLEEVLG